MDFNNNLGNSEETRILIRNETTSVRYDVEKSISTYGIHASIIYADRDVLKQVTDKFYHIIIVEMAQGKLILVKIITHIKKRSPSSKIIVICEDDTDVDFINEMNKYAFGLLAKPIRTYLLSHTIKKALKAQQVDVEFEAMIKQFKSTQYQLHVREKSLEQLREQLLDSNNAMSSLARNLESARVEFENRVAMMAQAFMVPIVDRLREARSLSTAQQKDLLLLGGYLRDLTSGFSFEGKLSKSLSRIELHIASMIRSGLSTNEIAEHLNRSVDTIRTHRRNIRKKLNICNSAHSLQSYLANEMADGA